MSTKRVAIPSVFGLDGIIGPGGRNAGVVICHPHPLYGGEMSSNVVGAMEEGFLQKGFTTLKFNFRGVGRSGGSYDEGKGEVDDLLAAVDFLKTSLERDSKIILAGYSFGAWICSKAILRLPDAGCLFLVAYPFAVYETTELAQFRGEVYFVGGVLDDICPMDALVEFYRTLPTIEKHLKIIPTDHFYGGREQEIVEFIKEQVSFP
ncbi:MAG TPA: alpha/beta fold hydrolase [Syntrophorhabdaceae bacterium]|jgi:hypothetical protein